MSKGIKQQYKQFTVNSIQDACCALGSLISGMMIHIEKYKRYAKEVEILLRNSDSDYISADDYDDINDKLLFRQQEMLKLCADHQSSSFSYINLRKLLEKKDFLKEPLSSEMTTLLNELLDIRNWSFHNTQSRMTAAREAAEKRIPEELRNIVKVIPQLNPVIVYRVKQYERLMLVSLSYHVQKRIVQFEGILQCMKDDYQNLYDSIEPKAFLMTEQGLSSKIQYMDRDITAGLADLGSDAVQISMAIQKSKYDGSDEKYKEWVVRL